MRVLISIRFQGPFLLALCAELATEGKSQNSRQLAGLFIKNLITGKVRIDMEALSWIDNVQIVGVENLLPIGFKK